MENSKVYICMSDQEATENMFIDKDRRPAFYKFISEKLAGGYDNVQFIDCTKVEVATNIMDKWFNDIPSIVPGITKSDVSMAVLMSGPKANENVPNNTVVLEKGCFKVKEDCEWSKLFPEDLAVA